MYLLLLILKLRKNSCFCYLGFIMGIGFFMMIECVEWSVVNGKFIMLILVG